MNPTTGLPMSTALQQAVLLVARGNALQKAGDLNSAAQAYQQAIRLAPLSSPAYVSLLELLISVGDTANAKLVIQAVPADLYPRSPTIRYVHARLLLQLGQPGQALPLLQSLAGSTDVNAQGLAFNLGLCNALLGRHTEAISAYESAYALGLREAWLSSNWARSAQYVGDMVTAEKLYLETTRNLPNNIPFKYELAVLLLRTGQFARGFRLYHHRWEAGLPQFQQSAAQQIGLPQWNGPQAPRSVLVTREQGIGEQIVFSTLLPALARKVEHLAVSFDSRLYPLIRRTWPAIECTQPDESLDSVRGRFDACVSAGDIGALVPEAVGWKDGYLAPELGRTAQLREKYRRQFPGKRLVGLSWLSKLSALSESKSMDLLDWRPLLEQQDCQFINLQYGEVGPDLARVRDTLGVEVHQDPEIDPMQDLDGLAAQMAALDLVITGSNSTAHIAAAIHAPTWVILPAGFNVLWYWGHKGNRCDWYPEARLFRSRVEGEWAPILAEVAAALQQDCGAPT